MKLILFLVLLQLNIYVVDGAWQVVNIIAMILLGIAILGTAIDEIEF